MKNSVILSKAGREIDIDTLLHPGDLIKEELKGNPTLSNTSSQGDFIELMAATIKDLKDEITKYHKQATADGTPKIEDIVKKQTGKEWADFVKADDICSDDLRMALAKIKETK